MTGSNLSGGETANENVASEGNAHSYRRSEQAEDGNGCCGSDQDISDFLVKNGIQLATFLVEIIRVILDILKDLAILLK